jgi:hypothetical protein
MAEIYSSNVMLEIWVTFFLMVQLLLLRALFMLIHLSKKVAGYWVARSSFTRLRTTFLVWVAILPPEQLEMPVLVLHVEQLSSRANSTMIAMFAQG